MKTSDLEISGYAKYYTPYINAVGDADLLEILETSLYDFIHFVREIPLGKHEFRYEEGKWTIKDIIQHLIDSERIFSYRALRISRNDQTPLPGFEENDYAKEAVADKRGLQSLLEELSVVRHGTIQFFRSLSQEELKRKGMAANQEIMAGAIGFVVVGHMMHHQRVFQERYLK